MLSSFGIKNADAPFNPNERRLAPVNNKACLAKPDVERVLAEDTVAGSLGSVVSILSEITVIGLSTL